MLELIAGVVVALVAVAVVLEPLISPRGARQAAADLDEAEFMDIEESESPKIQALLALKEIEFDRATGKLSEEDYGALKAKYAKIALEAMDAEERAETGVAADAAEELIRQAAQAKVCPACGPRPETDAAFCSECGQKLTAPAAESAKGESFCTSCGSGLPDGARFCGECGTKVEAEVPVG
ncbi:MAG: zinc ribbon domain-containing protein [Gemmatimonadales bacterium]